MYDRALLEWLKPIQEEHVKLRPHEVILDGVEQLLELSDEQLLLLARRTEQQQSARGLTLKKCGFRSLIRKLVNYHVLRLRFSKPSFRLARGLRS